ncbi:MAG TPA: phosphate acyltransferase PlsX, partial [Bdellovibrionota bacterium]|nr:phosphate acyltransferase PlsX [Bdellovibrionota bacterium]
MPKLILDTMGGDHAPHAVLEGAIRALPELEGELVLIGDSEVLKPVLARRRYRALAEALAGSSPWPRCKVSLIHASQTIEMDDSIRAIRKKPNASINVGCDLASRTYKDSAAAAFVSAGHSGAIMTAALLTMGRLARVERPAIAVKLPTLSPDGCVLIDVGANVDCKPEHLRDFALMGTLFSQVERKSPHLPRIGILSNGEERKKGNELTRASATLIENVSSFTTGKAGSPNAIGEFIGYVEGKEIFKGAVDVVVTDGFVGNVVLKSIEGLGAAVMTVAKKDAKRSIFAPLGFLLAASVFRRLKRRLDYAEYGAAPLLGVAGYAFICHGRSNPKAIKNALLRAQTALRGQLIERLEAALEHA